MAPEGGEEAEQDTASSAPSGVSGVENTTSDASGTLPLFLQRSKQEIHARFVDLEWAWRGRLLQGLQPMEPVSEWARVSGEMSAARNRYGNVDPYVNNRVRLHVPEGHNDYINASPIVLKSGTGNAESRYIATQGPKEASYSHIWRMVWHETGPTAVIVMLTQTHESGKEKCFQYFPQSMDSPVLPINEKDEFCDGITGNVTLEEIREDKATRSIVRKLKLENAGQSKLVWHLLFSAWPDFSIPDGEDRLALLELIKLSSELNKDSYLPTSNSDDAEDEEAAATKSAKSETATASERKLSPRIVHCSAGVGRSGTFMALDFLLSELAQGQLHRVPDDHDPISETVDELRRQRMMMVQGEAQYTFLYEVLREQWLERYGVVDESARESLATDEVDAAE